MKKNVSEVKDKHEKDLSFIEKYRTDKKYKAKVELFGYGVLIIGLIIYLNIASMNSTSGTFQNIIPDNNLIGTDSDKDNSLSKDDLLEKIEDNYEYDVQVSLKYLVLEEELEKNIHYLGKRYADEIVIEREIGDEKNTYYKINSMYYIRSDNEYQLIDENVVYDLVSKSYIELNGMKEYLDVASLDHVTDYSSGKKEYVYHLSVRDVVKTYTGDEKIEFSLVSENDILTVKVDYSNLIKEIEEDILECKVEYVYQNIGKVEEFHLMNDIDSTETVTE